MRRLFAHLFVEPAIAAPSPPDTKIVATTETSAGKIDNLTGNLDSVQDS